MHHCWRWFGPGDAISLEEVRQTGARGIVSALHHIPAGEAWGEQEILERKRQIEAAGLQWKVVESVPVHEDIKLQGGDCRRHTENFKSTLHRLGRQGISTVCYNFMPALDWSRTQLSHTEPDGSEVTSFNYIHFAAIDIHILRRPAAEEDYPAGIREEAGKFFGNLDEKERQRLRDSFFLGFPGSGESFSQEQVLERIGAYRDIGPARYRSHLAAFLEEVVPVAREAGIRLAIHPDDPPWPLLGMPRVFGSLEDAREIVSMVDSPSNGITLCTGSLGALHSNRLEDITEALAGRINFVHLRNVWRDEELNFRETHLLGGDVNMVGVMRILVRENLRRIREEGPEAALPVRPDHGPRILDDFHRSHYPGYSLYGRLKSLAEIRGIELGLLGHPDR